MEHYSKTRGRTTMKGEWFEVKTAALLYLRGINSNLDFHLGSNIEQARNFDDIVIKYRPRGGNSEWHTCFIQLKHKERAWLDASMLTTYDRGGFSLKKYLKSFSDIKSKVHTGRDHDLFDGPFETCDFVIYTNAPMVQSLAGRQRNFEIGPVQNLLKTSQRNESIVSFCEDSDSDIYRELESSGGSEAKEFLRKLKVFSGQPSEDKMDEVIKEELKVTCSDNMSDVDVIYRFFIEAVKQWWSEDEVNFLSHNSALLERALDQYKVFTISSHEKQTHRLNVKFESSALLDLKVIFNMHYSTCFVSCVNMPAQLGCTKVMQILREEKGAYTFMGLETLVEKSKAVIHGWANGLQPYLVILCNHPGEHTALCDDICNVVRKNDLKHAVIVCKPDDLFAATLKAMAQTLGLKYVETHQRIKLDELDQVSINRIMESQVFLQSKKLTLGGVLRAGFREADDIIKNNIVEIMSSVPVSLGRDLHESIDGCTRRYLERKDVVNVDVFQSNEVAGVIAVSNVTPEILQRMVPPRTKIGTADDSSKEPVRIVTIQSSGNAAEKVDFSGAERDFLTLCERHYIVHWLSVENDVIIWKRSKGNMTTIKQCIEQGKCTASNPNSTLDLNDRIVIIVEETSGQKPSLAHFLAIQTKKTHPYFWILKINLNEHIDLLKETTLTELGIITFLMSASCMDSDCRIETEFLQFCLKYSRSVIVVLEHFNEIPEDLQMTVVSLVKELLLTNVFQVLMTSAQATKDTLEDNFCAIAYTTRELTLAKDVQSLLSL